MNKNNILIAGAIAIGLYLFSQQKKTVHKTPGIPQIKKIAKKIPDASTPATRRKIAEKKAAAAAAAAEKAAEKAAFTPEIKLAISTLSTVEKIQALVAFRKKIAAKKKVSPQSISLTPDQRARVLLEAAIEKASKSKIAPIIVDYRKKKKKKNKTPGDIKKKFGSWDTKPKGQETSHKSTEPKYSKKKTKEEILKLFGLWALPTTHRLKSAIRKKRNKKKVARKALIRKVAQRRAVAKRMIPKNKNISKYRSLGKKRLLSRRKQR